MSKTSHVFIMNMYILGIIFAISTVGATEAHWNLEISGLSEISPIKSGSRVPITVTVSPDTSVSEVTVMCPSLGIITSDSDAPYEFIISFPEQGEGLYELTAFTVTGGEPLLLSKTIRIRLTRGLTPVELSGDPSEIAFLHQGQAFGLRVSATFFDGTRGDITSDPSTAYTSDNETAVTVNSRGIVLAKAPGAATITVRHQGLSLAIPVTVPNARRGDLNADGLVDQDDVNFLLSLPAGTVATGDFDARDLNRDGKIDSADAEVLSATCESRCILAERILRIGAVVNGASFHPEALAPGGLFTIFTSDLTDAEYTVDKLPLPVSLGGVSVRVNGAPVPLLYVGPTQVNAQLPYDTPVGEATISLLSTSAESLDGKVAVKPAGPGIFLWSEGRAVVQNQDYTLNTPSNPARPGGILIVYFTGQGVPDRPVASGTPSPTDPLARTVLPTAATIGGLPADVFYSGLAPGFAGLSQANIRVPNLPTGEFLIRLTIDGVISNEGKISVLADPKPPVPATEMEFLLIPSGEFWMGCSVGDTECRSDEHPRHLVRIAKPFELGKYEVTQSQWEAVMGANPSHFKGPHLPVDSVNWGDTQLFLDKLNARNDGYRYRLPTEAEWEYAARAGSASARDGDLNAIAWHGANSGGTTHPVGQKQPNAWGLNDMFGNVTEYCGDWYSATWYGDSPTEDPKGPSSGLGRVQRGGSWGDSGADNGAYWFRVSNRIWSDDSADGTSRSGNFGFRCVRERK
jgi:uncharacterized protein (TIGR03437 family)